MEHNADFTETRGKLFLTGKEPSALTFILQSQGKTRAVRGMPPSERRSEILRLLCKRRHETAINLATEFGVSERTIRNDLVILSCYYPIQVTWGRYGGVAHLPEWFHLENRMLSPASSSGRDPRPDPKPLPVRVYEHRLADDDLACDRFRTGGQPHHLHVHRSVQGRLHGGIRRPVAVLRGSRSCRDHR